MLPLPDWYKSVSKHLTGVLSVDELWRGINLITEFFDGRHITEIIVWYGMPCLFADYDLAYKPHSIQPAALRQFIENAIEKGLFRLGRYEFSIHCTQLSLEFLLCHESALHVMTDDQALLDELTTLLRHEGFEVFENGWPRDYDPGWEMP